MLKPDNDIELNTKPMSTLTSGTKEHYATAPVALDGVAYPVVIVTGNDNSYLATLRTLFRVTGTPFHEVPDSTLMDEVASNYLPLVYVGGECVGHAVDVYTEFMSGKWQSRLRELGMNVTRRDADACQSLFSVSRQGAQS